MLEINKKLISYNYTKGVTITPRYIVVHDTDNTDKGANADAHYRYFGGGDRGASAHYFVDDSNIIQILEDTWRGWHCGDRYNGTVNNGNSIGVETCVNKDGDYDKALRNTIDLVKYIMKKWNIPMGNVVRHYDVTGKYCPRRMLDNGTWDWFKKQLTTLDIPKDFNEGVYLNLYPDVADAVKKGAFESGAQHYLLYGKEEGRAYKVELPMDFNETFYLWAYEDVANAVKNGTFKSGAEHYQNYGAFEGRQYKPTLPQDFNESIYLEFNKDVAAAIPKSFSSAADHYLNFGYRENRIYKEPEEAYLITKKLSYNECKELEEKLGDIVDRIEI